MDDGTSQERKVIHFYLAKNTVDGWAALYEKLTGKKLTDEALARLREVLDRERNRLDSEK